MKKRIFAVIFTVFLCFSISACKATDYNDAMIAIENENYAEAIELFAALGNYKDSQTQLKDIIEKYANELVADNQHKKALELYREHSEVADFNNKILDTINKYVIVLLRGDRHDAVIAVYNEYADVTDFTENIKYIQKEKELLSEYNRAMTFLSSAASVDKGFEILNTLPSDFRNIEQIRSSYDALKSTKFKGTYMNYKGSNSQGVKFTFGFSTSKESFCIKVYKAVYWSDGTVYKSYNFDVIPEDINGNTIKAGKFEWTLNGDGTILEYENGSASIYN